MLSLSLLGTAAAVSAAAAFSRMLSFADLRELAASVFFTDSVTAEGLRAKFQEAQQGGARIKILIVPGHDSQSWGTEFQGLREADMTAAVGEELNHLLSGDFVYEPVLARSRAGYAPQFLAYFTDKKDEVGGFMANRRQVMRDLQKSGLVEPTQAGVVHNRAVPDVANKLYAFNRYANENGVDIVLHLHFNDYPRRRVARSGRYDGFAIYVPDPQYSNAKASRAVADALAGQFSKFYPASDLPVEEGGIVPDQDLIALGRYNTLDAVGLLIEYGYIYEPQFRDPDIRAAFFRELAFQTYLGLNHFFGKFDEALRKYPTTFLPYSWGEPLMAGAKGSPAVLSLQTALLLEGLYPPENDLRACPLTGSFGPCTARAVLAFQKKYAISPATGTAGEQTLQKLNELYSR